MSTDRRSFIKHGLAAPFGAALLGKTAAAAAQQRPSAAPASTAQDRPRAPAKVPYKRIATEEAWASREIFEEYRKLLASGPVDPGFEAQWGSLRGGIEGSRIAGKLIELGEPRIADMDAAGIDMQILSLTAPGVQVFDPQTATRLAALSNDQLVEAIRKYPTRYAGLAAVAPQDPSGAAKEIERAMTRLGLKGVIINSHTQGEYLDDQKFWELFEAAEAFNAPIYLHPQTPGPGMLQPYLSRGFERAILGFAHEVAFHTLAIIEAGVFDRFPRLRLVIGHGGEGLPYMLYRIDYMHRRGPRTRPQFAKRLPSEYMRENIYITTSGLAWAPAITMAQSVLGVDRVLYAMDYPYQYDIEEVTLTDEFPISLEDKTKLFQTNAEQVFALKS
ncbi:MAG: amidohydrolase family protein [Pseudomonadota bacterium]